MKFYYVYILNSILFPDRLCAGVPDDPPDLASLVEHHPEGNAVGWLVPTGLGLPRESAYAFRRCVAPVSGGHL